MKADEYSQSVHWFYHETGANLNKVKSFLVKKKHKYSVFFFAYRIGVFLCIFCLTAITSAINQ